MKMNASQLRTIFESLPKKTNKAINLPYRESIFRTVQFSDLSEDAICELARLLIIESCSNIGSFTSNGDPTNFLLYTVKNLDSWPKGSDLANRRLEHVAFAIETVANMNFAKPPGALASVYLLHQLEFVFRALSGVLTLEGEFIDASIKTKVQKQLGLKFRRRINDITETYLVMRLNQSVLAPQIYLQIDSELPHPTMPNGETLTTIGERIAYFRHPTSHGPLADPSSEGIFYALLMVIALYGSSLFPRS